MPANPSGIKGISTLFTFTPRQVLLSNRTMKNGTLNPEQKQKLLLNQSIALYLERSGFSKTLKKFLSEAKIENDNTEGSTVDLEEMCRKYLETGKDAKSTINDQKAQGVDSKNDEEKSKGKKKKKSNVVSESVVDNAEDNQLESPTVGTENKVKDDLSTDAKVDNGVETEKRSKHKKKKNNKSNIEGGAIEQNAVTENKVKDDLSIDAKVENGAETEKRSKHKMKKKDKSISEGDAKEQIGDPDATNEEAIPEEKKDSKKRKRPISKENDEQDTEMKVDEETKRRKIENGSESKGEDQSAKPNGHSENGAVQKSQKKKHKESSEQKPVKAAFQRVQVDKVEFVDERLQDNSYWAKDGAESGYGAKAEEILGQVRGRDFRHEKTKKKRGTYRGGLIDLHSHSVKFNYSDEE
ncbi:putative transcription factor interactor and regulator LisH family [Medicago truncatula]|uniref:Putative transcription factor interactor and regulator LisH family n=1 Tax=Medicago truncatula TaxID=3880 RepID=A0A396IGJ2_MEDTR|nr:putative transcription factor interactor and regulator LisH family [Medicago truncatula]